MNRVQIIHRALLVWMLFQGMAMADSGRIVVELQNIRDDAGDLRASIYRESDSFRKEERALGIVSQPARSGTASLEFDELPFGRYAVMAYHDANADQKLNLRFGMFPMEGYGLSNNPKVAGPPKFIESAFEHQAPETRITINLSY